ncbi:hypothetical protein HDA40_001613 [Hamadaea flava]|uniref:Uncharacterized protein n=1 Tax=Hamadaea flava TaxID=1742688 RepID=A0ABV8LPW9_9ACTN|nr:hypothetical protein [Hamadaea flava]MCP2323106.1 hypothetical protein [Hamadaea flava]
MATSRIVRALAAVAMLAGGALLSASSPATADTAPAISIASSAYCDTAGQWQITYSLVDLSPVDVKVVSLRDAVSGATLTPTKTIFTYVDWLPNALYVQTAPATDTRVGITVVVQRVDSTAKLTLTRVHPLPAGCAPLPAGTGCVHTSAARFRHTFDGAAGTATIELVGKPLCAGDEQDFRLTAKAGDLPFDYSSAYAEFFSATTKMSIAVNVPSCQGKVALAVMDPGGGGAFFEPNYLAGSSAAPGNHSSGPLGLYVKKTGPVCNRNSGASVGVACTGDIVATIWNAPTATTPALLAFAEVVTDPREEWPLWHQIRAVSLEPGENTTIRLSDLPFLRQYGTGKVAIYSNGEFSYIPWQVPAWCGKVVIPPLRRNGDDTPLRLPRRGQTTPTPSATVSSPPTPIPSPSGSGPASPTPSIPGPSSAAPTPSGPEPSVVPMPSTTVVIPG